MQDGTSRHGSLRYDLSRPSGGELTRAWGGERAVPGSEGRVGNGGGHSRGKKCFDSGGRLIPINFERTCSTNVYL